MESGVGRERKIAVGWEEEDGIGCTSNRIKLGGDWWGKEAVHRVEV